MTFDIGPTQSETTDSGQWIVAASEQTGITRGVTSLKLYSTTAALGALRARNENWDGYGSAKPQNSAISAAMAYCGIFNEELSNSPFAWSMPHVSSNEDGHVTLEWWSLARKLTIYVTATKAKYIKVAGPNITTDMEDGDIETGQFRELWSWLRQG